MTFPKTLALLCLMGSFAAHAETDTYQLSGFQINWDNDLWARGHTDRWYTNGIRATWAFETAPSSPLSKSYRDWSKWLMWDGVDPSMSYTVGQSMYTPSNITIAAPQPNDRPWGAYLYYGMTAHAYEPSGDKNEFRVTELKMGITGKNALGENAQSAVHKLISSSHPEGWDNQLKERLGVQLTHARVYRFLDLPSNDYVGAQLGWGVATGTLRTHGNVNAAAVVGNLKGKNAPLLVGNEGDYVVQDFNNREQFKYPFAFVAASLTGVVSNYFIDGETPYGRSNIKRKAGYTVFQWGVSLPLSEWIGPGFPRLVYAQSTRSPEFSSPLLSNRKEGWQRWGTLTAYWDIGN